MMQASLTVTTERLHAFEEKINSKFDALTAVECSLMLLNDKKKYRIPFCMQLLQTQNQLSQSLQEQFSRVQAQQCQVLELLAPLHPLLESVPLHISIARNAILEKIPKGCQCRCIDYCPGSSIPSAVPSCGGTPLENSEPLVEARKRRRISLDIPHPDSNSPPARGDRDQSILVEVRRTPDGCAQKPRETPTLAQPQRDGTLFAVQTPIGGKSGNEPVLRSHLGSAQSQSGNALLATRRTIISRGMASRVSLPFHTWLCEKPLTLRRFPLPPFLARGSSYLMTTTTTTTMTMTSSEISHVMFRDRKV
jgi:hypothetical protein